MNTDASKIIDEKIASLNDWRGELLRSLRRIIRQADPAIVEEWKWMGTPVWNHDGIVCLANAHKQHVKVTFPKGAKLSDPRRVFNAELEGKAWRAIDLKEGDSFDVEGLKGLILAAIALNGTKPAARKPGGVTAKASGARKAVTKKPVAKSAVAKKAPVVAKKPAAKRIPAVAKKPAAKKK